MQSSALLKSKVDEYNKRWKEALRHVIDYPQTSFSGRGIVTAAGGPHYLANAFVNLSMLRETGCNLPVEVWYLSEKEVVPEMMIRLEGLGAVCKDITKAFTYPIKGWEIKPHAIFASQFKEVLFLDADNVALRDPTFLFTDPDYQACGALFWPDRKVLKKSNLLWRVLELKPRRTRFQESGQLLIDKKLSWNPLQLCMHMNRESAFYYQHVHGDKDTFQLSWMCLNKPFAMIPYLPGIVHEQMIHPRKVSCLLQRDRKGKPLFCHTANLNWTERTDVSTIFHYYTLPKQSITRTYPPYSLLTHHYDFPRDFPGFEKKCLGFLSEVFQLI